MLFSKGDSHKQHFKGVLLFAILMISIIAAGNAVSAVIFVDASATGNNDGTTWTDAYTNLQDGINAGISGDEVWVAAGTYASQTFDMAAGVDLYGGFDGTETLREDRDWEANPTILDGEDARRVINGASAGLYGFTITRGFNTSYGGGLYVNSCNSVVEDCCFTYNTVQNSAMNGRTYGGAIYLTGSTTTITSCKFTGNQSRASADSGAAYGGAVYVTSGSSAGFVNCLFEDNNAVRSSWNGSRGGAIYQNNGTITLTNCTIATNSATYAGALYFNGGTCSVSNSIIWGNSSNFSGTPTVTYSCVEGGFAGTGVIDMDPLFADAENDDYHLKSSFGRWIGSGWTVDDETSPCVYSGDPTEDFSVEPLPNGGKANMGTYGNTEQASKMSSDVGIYVNRTQISTDCRQGSNPSEISLSIWNTGGGTLEYTFDDTVDWLSCAPLTGTSTGEHDIVTLYFDADTLAADTYTTQITVSAPGAVNSPVLIDVELMVFGSVIYVDDDAAGMNNGTSWTNALTDLQTALSVAQSDQEIWVAEGHYTPTSTTNRSSSFQLNSDNHLYGGFSGTETSRDERDWENNIAELSGDIGVADTDEDNSYTVVNIVGTNVVLDGFTVTEGNADGGDGMQSQGGGLFANTGTAPVIRNCIFSYNSATGYYGSGGGIYNKGSGTIENCQFIENDAGGTYGLSGGGIYNSGGVPAIINCYFYKNVVTGFNAYGGAIKNDASSARITNCIFEQNSAAEGSAIENWQGGESVITNCIFYNNNLGSYGIIDTDGAGATTTANIINCTFFESKRPTYARNSGINIIRNSIFRGHAEPIGGLATVTYSNIQGGYSGEGNIDADPLFVDTLTPAGADGIWRTQDDGFNLQASSPSKDTATADQAPGYDIRGDVRPVLAGVDMGAYEYDPYEYCGQTWYKDADDDGYATGDTDTGSCKRPDGYRAAPELTALTGDCDDTDANEHPGQTWYKDEDQDGYSDGTTDTTSCNRPDGYKVAGELASMAIDCDDTDPDLFPGQAWYKDADDDGYSDGTTDNTSCLRPVGYKLAGELTALSGDCDDTDANAHPDQTWYKDSDNDGYTDGTTDTTSCLRPTDYKTAAELADLTLDEDDSDGAIYPGAPGMLDYGLLAHYPFNGNADDISGNGNHGTVYGASLTQDRFGDNGEAYYFDGQDDWIELTDFITPESFTVALWIKPETIQSPFCVVGKHTSAGDNMFLVGSWTSSNIQVRVRTEAFDDGMTGYLSEYHLLSVVVEKLTDTTTSVKVYRNDQLLWEHTLNDVLGDSSGKPWCLGQDWDSTVLSDFFHGTIDEVWFYNRPLPPVEIHQLFDSGLPGYSNLINWNGNLVADFGDNGMWYHNGTNWNWMTNDGDVGRMVVWDGKLVVDFGAGKGIWYYDGSWHWMTNNGDPNMMIAWNNGTSEVLVVDFGAGQRIYTYDGSWHWFKNKDGVADMTVWNNKLIVDFGSGRGVYNYDTAWHWMTNKDDVNLMQPWDNGATERLVVDFGGGRRIYTYDGAWNWFINKDDVNDMTVWNQKLVVDFGGGRCLYNYDTSWHWMNNKDDAARMVTWRDTGTDLAVDFGSGRNMYNYDGSWGWIRNANDVPEMLAWNNRLVVDFGAGVGVYNYNGSWHRMKDWSTAE